MAAEVESPKMTNPSQPPLFHPPSLSSLPDDIIVNILALISKSQYRSLSLVSKSFYSLLSSPEIYTVRSQIGNTERCLYVCLQLPQTETGATHHRWFTIPNSDQTLMSNKKEIKGADELSLEPVKLPSSYCRTRLNSTTVAIGNEIYQIGGSNKKKLSRVVRLLDCTSHMRCPAPKMTVPRKRAKSCFLDGKIYVVGGCRKTEKPMNWGEVFDIKIQTWKPFPSPRNNVLKVFVLGAKLYIITNHKMYAYDPKKSRWEKAWRFSVPDSPEHTGPWCVINKVMYSTNNRGEYIYYGLRTSRPWRRIVNLEDLYKNQGLGSQTLQLVNYGGKLLIIWHERITAIEDRTADRTHDKRIWCAVIRLEVRRFDHIPYLIRGVIERMNVIVPKVHESCALLSCLSVSV